MRKLCIITNKGATYTGYHRVSYFYELVDKIDHSAADYFKSRKHEELELENGDVCSILVKINLQNNSIDKYVVQNIITKEMCVISADGVLVYSKKTRQKFFDMLFKKWW